MKSVHFGKAVQDKKEFKELTVELSAVEEEHSALRTMGPGDKRKSVSLVNFKDKFLEKHMLRLGKCKCYKFQKEYLIKRSFLRIGTLCGTQTVKY